MNYWTRPARDEDMGQILALNDLAFGGRDEGRIVTALAQSGDSLLSLVASDEVRIVGHAQFFRIRVDGAPIAVGLGPMSVHPNVQQRGIGGGLIRMGMLALEGRGENLFFVLGHPSYYPRFGFSAEAAAPFTCEWSGPAFMAMRLDAAAPEAGTLTYPAAFGA